MTAERYSDEGRECAIPTTSQGEITARVAASLTSVKLDNLEHAPVTTVTPNNDFPCEGRTGESVIVEVKSMQAVETPVWPGSPSMVPITGCGEFRCE